MLVRPSISLDYTLYDLYGLDNDGKSPPHLFYHPFGFKNDSGLPVKFVYNAEFGAEDLTADAHAQMELVVRGISQRYGFCAGKLRMIFPNYTSGEEKSLYQIEIERTFSQLRPYQLPNLSFVTSPDSIIMGHETGLAVVAPSDSTSNIPHAVDPEIHYELLSKRGLALSGLPTPPSVVIDADIEPNDVHGLNQLQQTINRMLEPLDTYRIPFVVKLNQSVSAKGVYIVLSEAHRARIKEILSMQLHGMLAKVNAVNKHLHPSSLILQDYIPGNVVVLSMFVTPKGRAVFIACCQQRFDKEGYWIGGNISYPDQETLKKNFAIITDQIAQYLHQRGYYGPVGADIVISEAGQHFVVDLNVRVTGTYSLGPLAGHFTKRDLTKAAIITEFFTCSRIEFETTFKAEITDGTFVICGWVREEAIGLSHGAIIVGATDDTELEKLVARVLALSSTSKASD